MLGAWAAPKPGAGWAGCSKEGAAARGGGLEAVQEAELVVEHLVRAGGAARLGVADMDDQVRRGGIDRVDQRRIGGVDLLGGTIGHVAQRHEGEGFGCRRFGGQRKREEGMSNHRGRPLWLLRGLPAMPRQREDDRRRGRGDLAPGRRAL